MIVNFDRPFYDTLERDYIDRRDDLTIIDERPDGRVIVEHESGRRETIGGE